MDFEKELRFRGLQVGDTIPLFTPCYVRIESEGFKLIKIEDGKETEITRDSGVIIFALIYSYLYQDNAEKRNKKTTNSSKTVSVTVDSNKSGIAVSYAKDAQESQRQTKDEVLLSYFPKTYLRGWEMCRVQNYFKDEYVPNEIRIARLTVENPGDEKYYPRIEKYYQVHQTLNGDMILTQIAVEKTFTGAKDVYGIVPTDTIFIKKSDCEKACEIWNKIIKKVKGEGK